WRGREKVPGVRSRSYRPLKLSVATSAVPVTAGPMPLWQCRRIVMRWAASHDPAGDCRVDAAFEARQGRAVAIAADDVDELGRIGQQPLPAIGLGHFAGIALVEADA